MAGLLKRHPQLILRPDAPLRRAMKAMTQCQAGLVMIADAQRRLLGVVADIDLRRALLSGADLSSPVRKAMNPKPVVVPMGTPTEDVSELFRRTGHTNIPIVDARGRIVELANVTDYAAIPRRYPNRVILMAGGQGRRLLPLTEDTPKPMLKLGGKPILEHLVEQLAAAGFVHFVISVNYLAEKIRSHFGDGSKWGVEIEYLHERKPLGTIGALGLLKPVPKEPFLVMNGDVLTKANFSALLDFHAGEKALATVCVKKHEIQIPFGVIELDGRKLGSFREKPTHRFLVNAGMYVMDPRALAWIPKNKPCDMPELLSTIGRKKRNGVACFPIEEYWLDIGGLHEFQRASSEFGEVFGS